MPSAAKRLAKINSELKHRSAFERLRYWKPTCPPQNDQAAVLESTAKVQAVFGGARSGKTELAVVKCSKAMMGELGPWSESHQPPVHGRGLGPSHDDWIEPVAVKKFRSLIPHYRLLGSTWKRAWSKSERQISLDNGSTCRLFSYSQDVDKMRSVDLDFAWMDEHGKEAIFNEHIMRLIDRHGWLLLTMTPESGITWEEERVIEQSADDPSIEFWYFTTYDNPHLSREGIKQAEALITDERLRDAKLRGRFVSLSGLVYPQFEKGLHVLSVPEIIPERWFNQFIIDPHLRKPTVFIILSWNPDGNIAYVVKEGSFAPSDGGVPELANYIRGWLPAGIRIDQWIADEAQGGDGLNIHGLGSVNAQLNDLGIRVVGTNQDSSKAFGAGVNKVRSMLNLHPQSGKPRIYVGDNCPRTIKGILRYQFRKETAVDEELLREHVRNKDDDEVTFIRYGVMAEPYDVGGEIRSGLDGEW